MFIILEIGDIIIWLFLILASINCLLNLLACRTGRVMMINSLTMFIFNGIAGGNATM